MLLTLSRPRLAPSCAVLIAGALALPAVGCSSSQTKRPGKVNLDGVVTVHGQPLKSGIIKFVCEDHEVCSADVANGKFTVVDVTPGKVTVTVEASGVNPGVSTGKDSKAIGGKAKPSGPGVDLATLKEKEYTVTADQMRIEITFP
jgi:hypothetical protein